jgi:hypothetical protein
MCQHGRFIGTAHAYSVIILAKRRERREQVPRVVCDPILRDHASPTGHMCIVSEREYARSWEFGWEEGLGPWFERVWGAPRLLSITSQAVNED